MAFPGTVRFAELSSTPSVPPAGYALIYLKTDNVLYILDSGGVETPIGSASFISELIGDVTAIGPGIATATVVSVGTKTAAEIAQSVDDTQDATALNVVGTIVKRDGSGNFAAGIITADLVGDVTGAASDNVLKAGDTMTGALNIFGTADVIQLVVRGSLTQSADLQRWIDFGGTTLAKIDFAGNLTATNFSGASTGTNTGDVTLATVGASPNASAASLAGQVLTLQPANSTNPGVLTAIAQSIGGTKTFVNPLLVSDTTQSTDKDTGSIITEGGLGVEKNINAGGNIVAVGTLAASNFSGASSGTNTGDVTLTAVGSSPNANAASLAGQALTLQPADGTNPGVLTAISQSIGGTKTLLNPLLISDTTQSTDKDTGSLITEGGIGVEKNINAGGNIVAVGTLTGSNFTGSSSGTNTGDVTLATFGSSPNANGASLAGQVLTLQPANSTNPGGVSTATQTFAGSKTLGANAADVTTIGAASSTAIHQRNGGINRTTRTVTATTLTVDTTTTDDIIYTDSTSNAITITLPTATNGRVLVIQDKTGQAATNHITITPPGAVLINGVNASIVIGTNYNGFTLISDGTNWTAHSLTRIIPTQNIAASNIDWSTGSAFSKTLSANTVFTFSNATSGQTIIVRLTNTASNYTVTWPTTRWPFATAPTMTTGAFSDCYSFFYDGSNFFGSYIQNMS